MAQVPTQIETGQDRTGDAVPGATDGARQEREGLRSKEVGSQHRGQSCILHTHLDGDGALLCYIEACQASGEPAQEIAQGVMAEYHGESPDEQHKAACHQVVMNGRDHTTYDDGLAVWGRNCDD